jgi:hypothetical protein
VSPKVVVLLKWFENYMDIVNGNGLKDETKMSIVGGKQCHRPLIDGYGGETHRI